MIRPTHSLAVAVFAAAILRAGTFVDAASGPAPRATPMAVATLISGSAFEYTVKQGDDFSSLGSRYGEGPNLMARENGMKNNARLKVGTQLRINNRHIVPMQIAEGIIINVPQRMLYYFKGGKLASAYPVAAGKANPKWHTPMGAFEVAELREHPTWHVPPSIQAEMEEKGDEVLEEVPPGPDNPLGDYWIGLSIHGIGVHATNAPLSIYSNRTHGCIRLHPEDANTLFHAVDIGLPGEIVYQPLMLARLGDGRIFIESNRDIYTRRTGGIDAVKALADANRIGNLIDWKLAADVINDSDGIAREVSLKR